MPKLKPYLKKIADSVPLLEWKNVTDLVWESIKNEGLDEEKNEHKRIAWGFGEIKIPSGDVANLISIDCQTIEAYAMDLVDLIDYTRGKVFIVGLKCRWKMWKKEHEK